MQPTILKIEQITTSDEQNSTIPGKQVTWMLGDDGPFYYTCSDVDFDADTIAAHMKMEAEKMSRLRDAFSS